MCISPTRNDRQVIVGSAQGKWSSRHSELWKGKVVHLFHGFNGSVRSIVADENTPYFVSCGLDRFLYLHNLNNRSPVKKLFLKSRLTGVQITKDFLAQLVNNSDDLQSSWHNIDMSVLPGAQYLRMERELIGGPSPKKFRKSKLRHKPF
ncbi:WD repeat-containing protein 74 [Folsomia candida]|uniref:WD repeat-containing protein 74 n=1 Tax=Folsomia candida TaxID=158441 RepID=A0A226CSQ3_FOLCA|nr:WD repeat-containing protein 74 [Folsomia candida]